MEEWKPIKNCETSYQISNYGRVKSLSRVAKNRYSSFIRKEKILKSFINSKGYLFVDLMGKTEAIHRLVWDYFGGRPRNGHKLQIDHIDGIKTNSHINNLQLLTNRENSIKRNLQNKLTLI